MSASTKLSSTPSLPIGPGAAGGAEPAGGAARDGGATSSRAESGVAARGGRPAPPPGRGAPAAFCGSGWPAAPSACATRRGCAEGASDDASGGT